MKWARIDTFRDLDNLCGVTLERGLIFCDPRTPSTYIRIVGLCTKYSMSHRLILFDDDDVLAELDNRMLDDGHVTEPKWWYDVDVSTLAESSPWVV